MQQPERPCKVWEQIQLHYNPLKERENRSEVFNYLLYQLELAVRKAARSGFECPENNVRTALSPCESLLNWNRHMHYLYVHSVTSLQMKIFQELAYHHLSSFGQMRKSN